MSVFRLIVFLLILGLSPAVNSAFTLAAQFVPGIQDLPLMAGLTPSVEEPMVFDTPAGRIVETTANGDLDRTEVLRFYGETLPQLGWRAQSPTIYRRDNERLRLHLTSASGGGLSIRFSLSPAAPK